MSNIQSPRYVDLLSDAGFKAVFADQENRELLRQTINLLLPEENAVEEITQYLDREQEQDFIGGKRTYYDLVCKGRDGKRFIVELQKEPQVAFFERCVFYSAHTYHKQLKRKGKFRELCPVFLIGILNFKLKHADESQWGTNHLISEYQMIEKRTGELAPPTISCIFAELGRFSKPLSECNSDRDVLFYMIKHGRVLEELPSELEHRPYAEALAVACEIAGFSEVKKQIYDNDMMSERDIEAKCEYAFEEGEAKGAAKGREEGRAEGAASIVSKFLQAGFSAEQISSVTGLPLETVLSYRR